LQTGRFYAHGIAFSEAGFVRSARQWKVRRRHQRSSLGLSPLEFRDSLQRLVPECGGITGDGSFTGTFDVSYPTIERCHQLGQMSQRARSVD
jgi:hypothetical protein